jgi:alcohol dehydrogenase class IV
MPVSRFSYGPKVLLSAGASSGIAELLPRGRCLFVTDARVLALGLADGALASLATAGVETVIFDAVEPDGVRLLFCRRLRRGQSYGRGQARRIPHQER